MMHPFGRSVSLHLYGRSHGASVGCILEGLPPGVEISKAAISRDMDLRRPYADIGTQRREADLVEISYGITDGKTDGLPILIRIENTDIQASQYELYKRMPRPGHGDLPSNLRFGDDNPAEGQLSGRLTAPIVAAGSIAKQFIGSKGIKVAGFTKSVGSVADDLQRGPDDVAASVKFGTRACTGPLDKAMREEILKAASEGDSVGGVIECHVYGIRPGFGGVWFDALDTEMTAAVMSIPGAKGVEFGGGFGVSRMRGSAANDPIHVENGNIVTGTNIMGGVLGGMSTGMPLVFRAAFKPAPSIAREQETVDLGTMKNSSISIEGRHDPCIVPRAVAAVEAMAAIVIADQVMRS